MRASGRRKAHSMNWSLPFRVSMLGMSLLALAGCSPARSGDDAGAALAPIQHAPDASTIDSGAPQDAGAAEPPCPPIIGAIQEPDGGAPERHRIPNGLVGIAFSDPLHRTVEALPLDKAMEIKTDLDAARKEPGGQYDEWFFDAFDSAHLFFYVAHYKPNPKRGRPYGTFEIQHRYRVHRTREAEEALHVSGELILHEAGLCGIKAGMSQAQVHTTLGAPARVHQLQQFGDFDEYYPGLYVRYLGNRVAFMRREILGEEFFLFGP